MAVQGGWLIAKAQQELVAWPMEGRDSTRSNLHVMQSGPGTQTV